MRSIGNPAASTALPHPAKVNQKVPKNSAPSRLGMSIQMLQAFHKGEGDRAARISRRCLRGTGVRCRADPARALPLGRL
jgi:hypothetical protein